MTLPQLVPGRKEAVFVDDSLADDPFGDGEAIHIKKGVEYASDMSHVNSKS